MKPACDIVVSKPTTKLKLTLLPPKENKSVTNDDVKYFYKKLATILISNN